MSYVKVSYMQDTFAPACCLTSRSSPCLYTLALDSATHFVCAHGGTMVACKIPLLARRTPPMQLVGQARCATIGYLVYKDNGSMSRPWVTMST